MRLERASSTRTRHTARAFYPCCPSWTGRCNTVGLRPRRSWRYHGESSDLVTAEDHPQRASTPAGKRRCEWSSKPMRVRSAD